MKRKEKKEEWYLYCLSVELASKYTLDQCRLRQSFSPLLWQVSTSERKISSLMSVTAWLQYVPTTLDRQFFSTSTLPYILTSTVIDLHILHRFIFIQCVSLLHRYHKFKFIKLKKHFINGRKQRHKKNNNSTQKQHSSEPK